MADESSDRELLEQYASNGSHEAFERLVARHFAWVISSARRQVQDEATAQDVAQAVFIVLARKPPRLGAEASLSPWLFGVVHRTCLTAIRARNRRRHHEQKAATMTPEVIQTGDESSWSALAPHLDSLLHTLKPLDRQILLLRFFEKKSLAEVGRTIGVSEDASRKRVDRAIERLRTAAAKRNLRLAVAGALAAVLTANVTEPVQAHVIHNVAASALATLSPAAVPTTASILADTAARSLVRSALKISIAVASIATIAVIVLVAATSQPASHAPAGAMEAGVASVTSPFPTSLPATKKLRVGYIVSQFTVNGPGRSFNGGKYTHAHPKVVPALSDPSVEMWAVLEPGSEKDLGIEKIVQDVFGGRQLNGADASQLQQCDVIVAAGVRNETPEVMQALTIAVQNGTGFLSWIDIGVTTPGIRDPLMRRLNGLSDSPDHGGRFSLDWEDATIVGSHEILGNLSGKIGTKVKFRPELVWGLDPATSTPLVQIKPDPGEAPSYPLYVSTLGKGRIVHFGFATYTAIPKEFDQAVGGHFALRCLDWLAHRPLPPLAASQPSPATTKAIR